jgi:hypothetical protein
MPVRMRKLRQPKRRFGIGKDEKDSHGEAFRLQDRSRAIVQRDGGRTPGTLPPGQAAVLDDLAAALGTRASDDYVERR